MAITALLGIAGALVTVIVATTGLFVGRSTHGERVGRLRISGYRFDAASGEVCFSVENTGPNPLFSARIRGARRDGKTGRDFDEFVIEGLEPSRELTLKRRLAGTTKFVPKVRRTSKVTHPIVVVRADYVDHADRSCGDERVVEILPDGSVRLLRSRTRLRWYSLG